MRRINAVFSFERLSEGFVRLWASDHVFIAAFLSLQATFWFIYRHDFRLHTFEHLFLGQATQKLIDAQGRILLYYYAMALAAICFLAAAWLLQLCVPAQIGQRFSNRQ